jgi:NAD(P)-dependent dehydrogenase (short-subunit alcohol dehydrogenase family)
MAPGEFDLRGRVAVVTGASRSIGRATALALAEAGADVFISGRDEGALAQVARDVSAATGVAVLPYVGDVAEEGALEAMFERCGRELGPPGIAVVNAGVFQVWQPSEALSSREWDRVVEVDLRAAALTCLAAGRRMLDSGGGSIVAVSSVAALVALPGTLAYGAAKAGLAAVTRSLAVEWATRRVRVNCVAPGFIERDTEPLNDDAEALRRIHGRTPMARLGSPREVALAVLFLASDAAAYITGVTLPVDGGWMAA